ncbi:2Fe-2S iron-sulfur cluster-binding protein [Streptomyces sp. CB01635]|uniref:2Fe-2S iron-sulfur cluster-binding protein n=1 Tax=Streptomyces sp. CB01635 TaxID=2020326 RepID=UPI001F1FE862|nr:2Fe-2S iron-sulfur cluster binding domain-containing protein [Streptomyces sp. CB01635]
MRRERYFSLGDDVFAERADPVELAGDGHRLHVELDGEEREVAWPAGTPLLDALLAAGVDAPFSCREGACSACCCRVTKGEVTMARNEILDQRDLDEGYVLACQALPVSDAVGVTYS